METLNMRPHSKSIIDISQVAWELEDPFHDGGNFQLMPIDDGNWLCLMRMFGYWIDGRGTYRQSSQTRLNNPHLHRFAVMDKDFNFVRKVPCLCSTYYEHPTLRARLPYLEDARIAMWNGKVYAISTVVYQLPEKGWAACGLELQELKIGANGISATHVWNSLEAKIPGLPKNWLPVPGKPLNFVTATFKEGCEVLDVGRMACTQNGICQGELLRGNTPLVKDCARKCYWAITHTVDLNHPVKLYQNYLVEYDEDMKVRFVSCPFKLTEQPIEFVTDLKILGGDIQIGVTANDDTPEVHIYNFNQFLGLVNTDKRG